MIRVTSLFIFLFFQSSVLNAEEYDYQLVPEKIAEDTYVFIGKKEDFSNTNGGNIVNTGFIITSEGVIVIDTGPSLLYGRQMIEAIRKISNLPIIRVLITHQHPDHIFGNQAFNNIPVLAISETADAIKAVSAGYADNMYRLIGEWMRGTEPTEVSILESESETIGEHHLEYLRFSGHTDADLVIFDKTTGVIFCGDLVFNDRTLTTPNAKIDIWLESLNKLEAIQFKVLVPGHGDISIDTSPIKQTRDYLLWLTETLHTAANNGLDMGEVMHLPIPEHISRLALFRHEYSRSISHLYPEIELKVLQENY